MKQDNNKRKVIILSIVILFWLLLIATAIFYLRSAIVRVNEEVLYYLEFDTKVMNLRELIKHVFPSINTSLINLFPNIDIEIPSTVNQDWRITKTIYAPWMYSEMAFAIYLIIFSLILLVWIILYSINFDFKKYVSLKKIKVSFTIFTLLSLICGILGIMTFVQKVQYWDMLKSGAVKISNWVDYIYNDLFNDPKFNSNKIMQMLIPTIKSAISSMISNQILVVSKQSFVDVYSYSIAALILGVSSMIFAIFIYPWILFKKNKILARNWIKYFLIALISILLLAAGFYLTNFIKDVTSEASSETINIWNTATSYTVSTLLVSLLLIFLSSLLIVFTFIFIRNKKYTNFKLNFNCIQCNDKTKITNMEI